MDNPTAPTAAEREGAEELRIDAMLAEFQRACEVATGYQNPATLGMRGTPDALKHRAILRNELRAALLAARREVEDAAYHRAAIRDYLTDIPAGDWKVGDAPGRGLEPRIYVTLPDGR
jgi:hypothetical protein